MAGESKPASKDTPKRVSSGKKLRKKNLKPAINLSNCKYEVGEDRGFSSKLFPSSHRAVVPAKTSLVKHELGAPLIALGRLIAG